MLTLDRITLFYHSLREATQAKKRKNDDDPVLKWSAGVKQARDPNAGKKLKRSTTTAFANDSLLTVQSSSGSSSRSALNAGIGVKKAKNTKNVEKPAVDEETGGLSDHDETKGEERDMAQNSPVKATVRATSKVSTITKFEV